MVWKKVTKCTTGRVYLLEFTSANQRHFFWMQEPKADQDAEIEKKMNEILSGSK
jgi:hypothetical protein